jgi:Rrf2 family protein
MLSNSCKYAIRALVYLAKFYPERNNIGIREISHELDLPSPFLAKIMQQLAKQKVLNSIKGPNGGFSLMKKPESISLYDIVKIIDGEDLFTNCLIHDETCGSVIKSKKVCAIHDDYEGVRAQLKALFRNRTIAQMASSASSSGHVKI